MVVETTLQPPDPMMSPKEGTTVAAASCGMMEETHSPGRCHRNERQVHPARALGDVRRQLPHAGAKAVRLREAFIPSAIQMW